MNAGRTPRRGAETTAQNLCRSPSEEAQKQGWTRRCARRIDRANGPVSRGRTSFSDGRIAQVVEQLTLNQRVVGSSPTAPTKDQNFNHMKALGGARIWRVVRSACCAAGRPASFIAACRVRLWRCRDFRRAASASGHSVRGRSCRPPLQPERRSQAHAGGCNCGTGKAEQAR